MKTVFADTSYYLAFLIRGDRHSNAAQKFSTAYRGGYVTTTSVLTEVGNQLSRSLLRGAVKELVDVLRNNSRVVIVPETTELWDRALNLYDARSDKSWSLTDCLSFIVMQDRGLTEALTADRHFEQAGFTILLN